MRADGRCSPDFLQVRYPEFWSKDLAESLAKSSEERDADFREAYEEALTKMNVPAGRITDQVMFPSLRQYFPQII